MLYHNLRKHKGIVHQGRKEINAMHHQLTRRYLYDSGIVWRGETDQHLFARRIVPH